MSAKLTYYIYEGVLTGSIGHKMVHMSALSGGGGGSTKHKTTMTVNNPYMAPFKTVGGKHHKHGGPIPPGWYTIQKPATHHHLGLSARLNARSGHSPTGRGGFFIHGRGPHGSDGCIVPLRKSQFQQLMKELSEAGGGTLYVAEQMEDTWRFA